MVKVISLETINTKTPSHIQLAITFWTRHIFPSLSNQDLKIISLPVHQLEEISIFNIFLVTAQEKTFNYYFGDVRWKNSISHESLILY